MGAGTIALGFVARTHYGLDRSRSPHGDMKPLEVKVDGENINRAINQLKRKMANEGIYKELKKRRFYEKPSERKKRKAREAERRLRKAMRRQAKAKAKGRG